MTNKLVVIIKYQKLRKFFCMKWNCLYQITAASRTPDQGATAPQDPRSLCPLSTEFVEPPSRHWCTRRHFGGRLTRCLSHDPTHNSSVQPGRWMCWQTDTTTLFVKVVRIMWVIRRYGKNCVHLCSGRIELPVQWVPGPWRKAYHNYT